jgi:hypothetical protein
MNDNANMIMDFENLLVQPFQIAEPHLKATIPTIEREVSSLANSPQDRAKFNDLLEKILQLINTNSSKPTWLGASAHKI